MSNNELDVLIPTYAVNKAQMDGLKKVCDGQNAKIKTLMQSMTEYEAGGYSAKRTVRVSESFDEQSLLEVLHGIPELAKTLIKTQEYVDMDALESALYHGKLTDAGVLDKINKCRIRKESVVLTVKKVGGGKK